MIAETTPFQRIPWHLRLTPNNTVTVRSRVDGKLNEQTALNILARRMAASVSLVKALGGGWDASALR